MFAGIVIKENYCNLSVQETGCIIFPAVGYLAHHWFKGCSAAFLLVCFSTLKESTCETRKNVFCLTSKALFVLEKIKS